MDHITKQCSVIKCKAKQTFAFVKFLPCQLHHGLMRQSNLDEMKGNIGERVVLNRGALLTQVFHCLIAPCPIHNIGYLSC